MYVCMYVCVYLKVVENKSTDAIVLQDGAEALRPRTSVGLIVLDAHLEELSLEEEGDCLPSEIRDQFVCDEFTNVDGSLKKWDFHNKTDLQPLSHDGFPNLC